MRACMVFIVMLGVSDLPSAQTADPPPQSAPQTAERNIGVYGDSLADGLWSGLYYQLKKRSDYHLFRKSKVGTGLTTGAFVDWMREFTASLDEDHISVAVIMFGANDQQGLRDENHKGYLFKSDGWKRVYSARVGQILAETAKRQIATIWVGLPVMRDKDLNEGAEYLDSLYSEVVTTANTTFVPLHDTFKDENGEFALRLPDAKGKSRLVRADDGVHFTAYGYGLIAEKVFNILYPITATGSTP